MEARPSVLKGEGKMMTIQGKKGPTYNSGMILKGKAEDIQSPSHEHLTKKGFSPTRFK